MTQISHSLPIVSRTGVYGIAQQNGHLLLVKQQKGPHVGKFEWPGGGIEPGETIEQALRRELFEEVGMTFNTMQLFGNFTAMTEATHENGVSYLFHQVGLIYCIDSLVSLQNQPAEMEYVWIDPMHLIPASLSPFVTQALAMSEEKSS